MRKLITWGGLAIFVLAFVLINTRAFAAQTQAPGASFATVPFGVGDETTAFGASAQIDPRYYYIAEWAWADNGDGFR